MMKNLLGESEEKTLFQLFFLRNDENQSVEIEEVEQIDFAKIRKRLQQGEAVFITAKPAHKLVKRKQTRILRNRYVSREIAKEVSKKTAAQPFYFTHV